MKIKTPMILLGRETAPLLSGAIFNRLPCGLAVVNSRLESGLVRPAWHGIQRTVRKCAF
ncbi:MAG: hypothetical protein JWM21_101 [Acidobacteria bacterium]|nr:hypothetical protein [Acidobacteriota bacterium]